MCVCVCALYFPDFLLPFCLDDMGKLAPIFVKKKEKEKVISEVDSEALKLRRAFLMSGLTEEAKRQQQQQSNAMLSQAAVNYPPIPVENHVQQIPFKEDGNEATGLDVWNLTEVSLPGLTVSDENLEVCFLETPEWSCPSSLLRTYEDKEIQPLSNKVRLTPQLLNMQLSKSCSFLF